MDAFHNLRRHWERAARHVRAGVRFEPRAVWGLVLIVGYLLAVIGYPAGPVVASKEGGEPFPCQTTACGCRTAAQCRTSCCCRSKAENIAWALARGIDPNRVAVLNPAESAHYAVAAKQPSVAQVCHTPPAATKPSRGCCASNKSPAASDDSAQATRVPASGPGWVLGIMARSCRGLGSDWIQAGFVALPPPPVAVEFSPAPRPTLCYVAPQYTSPTQERLPRPG